VSVQGAEPLFLLRLFCLRKTQRQIRPARLCGGRSIAKGCELSGCALIGRKLAEMPGMYPEGEYDLAGFAVGAVENPKS
jgi:phosphoribosylformylglycinamidine cyclo-ligase